MEFTEPDKLGKEAQVCDIGLAVTGAMAEPGCDTGAIADPGAIVMADPSRLADRPGVVATLSARLGVINVTGFVVTASTRRGVVAIGGGMARRLLAWPVTGTAWAAMTRAP